MPVLRAMAMRTKPGTAQWHPTLVMTTDATREDCRTNITRAGRRRRLQFGVGAVLAGLGAFALMRALDVPAIISLAVSNVLLATGATSIFQSTQNT